MKRKTQFLVFIILAINCWLNTAQVMTNEIEECLHCKPLKGGENFMDCRPNDVAIINRNGSTVNVNLIVDIADIKIEWLEIKRRVYNGKLCGPTIEVKPGDKLVLTLENLLGSDQPDGVHNKFRLPNTTNIHLHGLHISPKAPGDDVFTRLNPGDPPHEYIYHINKDQPSGTYWYHAHWHGSTWFQVMSGLSGLLIVEDDSKFMPTELDEVSCPNHCENDVHVLLQSTLQYVDNADGVSFIKKIQEEIGDSSYFRLNDSVENWLMDQTNNFDYYTTNGFYNPTLQMKRNQMKRFRIVNAGGYVGLEVQVSGPGNCVIKEIAFDGIYLDEPRDQIGGQTYVTVGARVDWMIFCDTVGSYELHSLSRKETMHSIGEFRRYDGTFMTIEVIESNLPTPSFPNTLPDRPDFVQDLTSFNGIPESNKFAVEFANDFYMNRGKFVEGNDYKFAMQVGTVQEWTFINAIPDAPHPLHIHVNHFQVIRYNEYTGPISVGSTGTSTGYVLRSKDGDLCNDTYAISNLSGEDYYKNLTNTVNDNYFDHKTRWEDVENGNDDGTGLGYARRGDWRDVLNLPPLSNITVRFNVDEYDGSVVLHCHVLKHEDLGMMYTVKAYKESETPPNIKQRELGCQCYQTQLPSGWTCSGATKLSEKMLVPRFVIAIVLCMLLMENRG